MASSPSRSPRRGAHRKRISALRLSSDTIPTLPAYTSPLWNRPFDLPDDASDLPPDYPDSAEEADADTDSEDHHTVLLPPLPQLPVSPRRSRRSNSHLSRSPRRPSTSSDSYLDSLLERSVHALELSNALLQSSMSTQTSLSALLASDNAADRSLEEQAQQLSSRIRSSHDLGHTWADDLEEITRDLGDLVGKEVGGQDDESRPDASSTMPVSKSLPTSGLAERLQRTHRRRPSLDLRHSASQLQLSNHERNHFVSPPPRALTLYLDSDADPAAVLLPSTLGIRPSAQPPLTPLPPPALDSSRESVSSQPGEPPPGSSPSKRAADVLASLAARSPPSRSSSASSRTIRNGRMPKTPPPPLNLGQSPDLRSRSLTPRRMSEASPTRGRRPMTPTIEELSASSSSSASSDLHVDRTLTSLRSILAKQPSTPPSASASPSLKTSRAASLPRPSRLSPPTVVPMSSTSNATASVSRLFTKVRHQTSTCAPSPPRSALKNRSAPPTPSVSSPGQLSPSPSSSGLNTSQSVGLGLGLGLLGFKFGRDRAESEGARSTTSSSPVSGRSTPKRISFAELPESHSGSLGRRDKSKGRLRGKSKRKGKSKDGKSSDKDEEEHGWWMGWLLGAAGTGSGSGLSVGATVGRDDRAGRSPGSTWAARPGFGYGALEEWGA
ncbi:hypothetical protein CERSUDRAFT_111139 [Gelatoporia subvermispora B]|uniref:Uncharacterized protein n=1 Tax=Ceriporiopsis subvermispora (strain B) TaxID=914234 RepID=M2PUV2_CERS8|nr:hypothetical protein CERSUDRAFT_111139 [Gelatoporia subvermispora B]